MRPLKKEEPLIFERSRVGKVGVYFPERHWEKEFVDEADSGLRRVGTVGLPEVTESEVVRHFTKLSQKNFSIDTHFYPLGSCTMKYNPRVNELVAELPGFAHAHPLQPTETLQGILKLLYLLEGHLKELTGMDRFTLQPAAGAHGELLGMMIVKAYFEDRKDTKRRIILVPDSSHGTNPASAAQFGFEAKSIPSNKRGRVDLNKLREILNEETACLMLTNPNTLGLFEEDILEIVSMVHQAGGLLYYDGANMNPMMGICRPGDMGFDIMHLNLHKTFSTPHGGGGPGGGPVGVKSHLADYLPYGLVEKTQKGVYDLQKPNEKSVGRLKAYLGNMGVMVRAYTYIQSLGIEGIRRVGHDSILNANYLRVKLSKIFNLPINESCMHEFVLSAKDQKAKGVSALDIGKRLLDYGFHAPTVYFPLIIPEAMMIEPTETESKQVLDEFIEVMGKIAREVDKTPEVVKTAPHTMPVTRCDEVGAARCPNLCYTEETSLTNS